MNLERLNIKANVHIVLRDCNGKIKFKKSIHNTMTSSGLNGIMDRLNTSPSLPISGWMELGDDAAPAITSGHLKHYIADSRHAVTMVISGAVATFSHTWAAGEGTGAITEAGLFDVVTQNTANAWCYASFGAVTKTATDSFTLIWTITASAS